MTDLVGRGKELLGQSLEKQAQKPWSGSAGESQGKHGQGMIIVLIFTLATGLWYSDL